MDKNLDIVFHIERINKESPDLFKYDKDTDYLIFDDYKIKLYLDELEDEDNCLDCVYTILEIYIDDNLTIFTNRVMYYDSFCEGSYDYELISDMKSLIESAQNFKKYNLDSEKLDYHKTKHQKIGFSIVNHEFNFLYLFEDKTSQLPYDILTI